MEMPPRVQTALSLLLITATSGCSTTGLYISQNSKRDVAECIFKGWEAAPASAPVSIVDYTDYYFVGTEIPNPVPLAKHPESVVWAEVKDQDGGSSTEYRRSLQIFHKIHDRVVVDCQIQHDKAMPVPFITSDSVAFASLEGVFARNGAADWDELSVKAVDNRLFIPPRTEQRLSSLAVRVSPGEHEITVRFAYNRNNWPKTGEVKLIAKLTIGATYKLRPKLEGSEYRIELYDKESGQTITQTGSAEGSPMPLPPIAPPFIFHPFR